MMGSQVEEINWERKPEGVEVESMWEKMNGGVNKSPSNKPSFSNVNAISQKANNNWMAYLGLALKVAASPGQNGEVQQSVTSDEDKKVASLWEQMNQGNWMTYLGMETKKMEYSRHDEPQRGPSDTQNRTSGEARKLAAAAFSAVKDAAAAAAGKGKVEIREARDFAGQEIEVRKLVDADSRGN